jgi:drug/metabolite transporter (DMT)-like permease
MSQRRGGNASTNNNTNNRAYHQSSMMMISEEENIIMDFDDANNNNEEEESAAGRVLAMMNATTSSSSSSSSSSLFITSRKKTRGYLAVFLVSAIWVCASFIVKDLERVGDPLTLTALFNALFLVYWPVEMKGVFLESSREKGKRYYAGMFRKWKEAFDATTGTTSTTSTSTTTTNNRRRSMAMKLGGANEALRCYVIVPPLFFLAQFFFNKSLQFVSVTVNTALSSVAPALTYVLGIYRGLEKPVRDSNGFLKALGLVALGVVLTAVADDETAFGSGSGFANDGENSQRTRGDDNNYDSYDSSSSANSFVNLDTAWGVALILASAVCYAGYATEVEIALNSVKVSDGNRYENSSNNRNSNPFFSRSSGTGGVLLERDEEEQTEEEEAEREAKKELLAAIKDSKSRQILASVGTFAFVIVLCTMRKSISSMSESGGMIILKGLIDNALAEYLWCVGVAELGASVASIGLLLQIPLSAVAELLFARADEEVWTRTSRGIFAMFCGCALIVYGFIGAMKFAGSSEEEEEEDGEDEELDDSNVARAPLL